MEEITITKDLLDKLVNALAQTSYYEAAPVFRELAEQLSTPSNKQIVVPEGARH
jgi:ribosomal protein L18E